jgi:hypothetical protein
MLSKAKRSYTLPHPPFFSLSQPVPACPTLSQPCPSPVPPCPTLSHPVPAMSHPVSTLSQPCPTLSHPVPRVTYGQTSYIRWPADQPASRDIYPEYTRFKITTEDATWIMHWEKLAGQVELCMPPLPTPHHSTPLHSTPLHSTPLHSTPLTSGA